MILFRFSRETNTASFTSADAADAGTTSATIFTSGSGIKSLFSGSAVNAGIDISAVSTGCVSGMMFAIFCTSVLSATGGTTTSGAV